MRRIHLLSTAASFAAALLAVPAMAQQAGSLHPVPAQPMPGHAMQGQGQMQGQAMPGASSAMPMRGAGAGEGGMQYDAMGRQEASQFLNQAEAALRRGHISQANDLLERAETRLLTRSTLAAAADQPSRSPAVERIASARQAVGQRDRNQAMQQIAEARSMLSGMGADDMATGAGAGGGYPMQGGGPGGYGAGTAGSAGMRDQGMGARNMSRADAIILAQQGSEGSGGLPGSTTGSPGVGAPGSTPRETQGRTGQQPAQGSAVPLAPSQGSGRAAPLPGNSQAPGGTGVMPGDAQRRGPPAPGSTSGTTGSGR